jgi:hypothetical protein
VVAVAAVILVLQVQAELAVEEMAVNTPMALMAVMA